MTRRRASESLGYEPDPKLARIQMQDLVVALNRTTTRVAPASRPKNSRTIRLELSHPQMELRSLVERWKKSGPNLRRLFAQEPELEHRTMHWEMLFYATDTGRGYLDSSPVRSHISLSPEDRALKDFMALITNPQWDSLGGPCRRCGNYYLKKTKRQNVYCSRVCSSGETAVSATRKWREREQAKKIDIAQKATAEWSEKKRRLGWKEWVSNETGYSVRWISRAVNNETLQSPNENPKDP